MCKMEFPGVRCPSKVHNEGLLFDLIMPTAALRKEKVSRYMFKRVSA